MSNDGDSGEAYNAGTEAGLKQEQRAFAAAIGKAVADTSFQMTHVLKDAKPRKWRKND